MNLSQRLGKAATDYAAGQQLAMDILAKKEALKQSRIQTEAMPGQIERQGRMQEAGIDQAKAQTLAIVNEDARQGRLEPLQAQVLSAQIAASTTRNELEKTLLERERLVTETQKIQTEQGRVLFAPTEKKVPVAFVPGPGESPNQTITQQGPSLYQQGLTSSAEAGIAESQAGKASSRFRGAMAEAGLAADVPGLATQQTVAQSRQAITKADMERQQDEVQTQVLFTKNENGTTPAEELAQLGVSLQKAKYLAGMTEAEVQKENLPEEAKAKIALVRANTQATLAQARQAGSQAALLDYERLHPQAKPGAALPIDPNNPSRLLMTATNVQNFFAPLNTEIARISNNITTRRKALQDQGKTDENDQQIADLNGRINNLSAYKRMIEYKPLLDSNPLGAILQAHMNNPNDVAALTERFFSYQARGATDVQAANQVVSDVKTSATAPIQEPENKPVMYGQYGPKVQAGLDKFASVAGAYPTDRLLRRIVASGGAKDAVDRAISDFKILKERTLKAQQSDQRLLTIRKAINAGEFVPEADKKWADKREAAKTSWRNNPYAFSGPY